MGHDFVQPTISIQSLGHDHLQPSIHLPLQGLKQPMLLVQQT